MPSCEEYTVGWICALHKERVAAEVFLDKTHEGPKSVSLNDRNHYTLGQIGKHYVVIAVLQAGGYGISSATGVARDMLHSFPNVRIGLMVGIGGGAPSRNRDVRLGDIVVSTPCNGKGGVFQYDFGKTIQDESLQPTGFLNKPPTILQTAMEGLKAQYEIHGHQIESTINSILDCNPRLRRNYKRPAKDTDRLYRSTVTHPAENPKASCMEVCGSNQSDLEDRPERAEDEDNPKIHYGLIASGSQVIRNSLLRDELADKYDVLCFDMEAAGLMNQFPCLVVRGICDYSDSHKNDEWQGYAAMAAAAYTKDLLNQIYPTKIEAEKKIVDILPGQSNGPYQLPHSSYTNLIKIEDFQKTLKSMTNYIDKIRLLQNVQEQGKILNWLASTDYSSQRKDLIKRRVGETGQWVLKSNQFNEWISHNNRILFCPGIPGAGKTMVTSIVVDHLARRFSTDGGVGVAYLYFDYQRKHEQQKQVETDLFLILLRQLSEPCIPEAIIKLYNRHTTEKTWLSEEEILNNFCAVAAGYQKVFIVIDALDECISKKVRTDFLSTLFDLQAKTRFNIFATSRFIPDIEEIFKIKGAISLEVRASDEDIYSYLDSRISALPSFVRKWNMEESVKSAIIEAAGGMFLLATLYLDSLTDKTNRRDLLLALEKLSKGSDAYNNAYEEAMKRIRGQGKEFVNLAISVLSWIVCSKWPLSPLELQHALAVTSNASALDELRVTDIELIVSACAGLVTVDEESAIIRLVHHTVQEYFERTWVSWFPDRNRYITNVLCTYLSFEQFTTGACTSWKEYTHRLRENPLYEYAASNWGYHANEEYGEVKDFVSRFLQCNLAILSAAQVLKARAGTRLYVPRMVKQIHLAAHFGINEKVAELLQHSVDREAADDNGQTALHWASNSGQTMTVEQLLRGGSDVNAADYEGKTALHYAASQGNTELILLILKYGADIESEDKFGRTPLLCAAVNGKTASVEMLLSRGAIANAIDRMNRNALHLAIISLREGSAELAQLLLSHGTRPDLCDAKNMTPLYYAISTRNCQVVEKFIQADADINIGIERKFERMATIDMGTDSQAHESTTKKDLGLLPDVVGLTALHFAACIGSGAMTEYLLSQGANPNARCQDGETPLHIALRGSLRYTEHDDGWTDDIWRIEILTDSITDPESEYADKIHQQIRDERKAVVDAILANKDIDVNVPNTQLERPLHMAFHRSKDSHDIIAKLLRKGADPFARGKRDQLGLHLACRAGYSDIVSRFLDAGCSIAAEDLDGFSAFHYAVLANHHDTAKLILEHDTSFVLSLCRQVDKQGKNLLHHYLQTENCTIDMINVLLGLGVTTHAIDSDGNSPLTIYLQTYQFQDITEICGHLLQHGADPLWSDSEGRNLAHIAMFNWRTKVDVLKLCKTHGVDVAAKDKSGKNILHHGAIHGSLSDEIICFALKNKLNPNERDRLGQTPLMYAAEEANKKRPADYFEPDRYKKAWKCLKNI